VHHSIRQVRALLLAACALILLATSPMMAGVALAEDQPTLRGDPAQEAAERERLFTELAAAKNATEAAIVAGHIWELWFRAPNAAAGALMDQARASAALRDYAGASALFDQLITTEPEWAEAWNQRATFRYVIHDFNGSLDDIDHVLALEPKHFGALSGQALILMHQGNMAGGQAALRKAVAIDPFLSTRALLMGPKGQDI
jgi:tetratricopeptide (TPR) repeat protein